MSAADALLIRLEAVREREPGSWIAKCPSHQDRSPSLSVRETNDGTVLLKCFAGCGAADVVGAVGLSLRDLFPERPEHRRNKDVKRPRINPWDLLRALSHRCTVLLIAAEDLSHNKPLNSADLETVRTAAADISRIIQEVRDVR